MNFNNITISKKDGATFIKYYKTIIVQFSENLILLNTILKYRKLGILNVDDTFVQKTLYICR